ncbi:hypothetical protein [Halomonas alimentaria]|uniref:Uncharacterized protein n=1 Tax=Halomonas alimentaria TaxID=147248 RepID=A0A7X4W7L4_9GAMM|nr:hypothetical protein [Halomonas alimentaria]NAW35011.1 hypothetical protein [Halomonas alimentaria]
MWRRGCFLDLIRKLGGLIEVGVFSSTLRRLEQEGKILVRGVEPGSMHYWDRTSLKSGETATALCGWWEEFSQAVHGGEIERSAELQVLDAALEEEEEEDWDQALAAPAPR